MLYLHTTSAVRWNPAGVRIWNLIRMPRRV